MRRLFVLALLFATAVSAQTSDPEAPRRGGPPVYVTFLWHMHQPLYTPGESVVQTDASGRFPFSLTEIHTSRTGPYTTWPGRATGAAASRGLPSCGAQVSFSASLMQNLDALAAAGRGFSNWTAPWQTARAQTTARGNPRLDLVGFGGYHPLMPLVAPGDVARQVAAHRDATSARLGGAPSRGLFPPETAFSTRILPELAQEGIEWVLMDNAHLERAAEGFPWSAGGSIVEPNRADIVNPNPGDWRQLNGLWAPTPVSTGWAHRPHIAAHVDPETGAETRMVVVPASRYLGNEDGRGGFGALQYEAVLSQLEDANTDPDHPILVVLHHDGDNFGGGSESYYNGNWDAFLNWLGGQTGRFECTTVQDYLDQYPPDPSDVVHVADGSWAGADGGDPEFKKWLADPNEGVSPDRHSWAVLTAAEHAVRSAEAASPGNANVRASRRLLLQAEASDYWYWDGSLGGVWDAIPTRAANAAVALAAPFVGGAAPALFVPQREPYNPGGTEWGQPQPSDFEVWTYAAGDLSRVTLRIRQDADGRNDAATTDNETFAGGPGVGDWADIEMHASSEPRPPGVPAPARIAPRYGATVTGYTEALLDYVVEAEDTAGRITRSPIQHVWVGSGSDGGPGGASVSWAPTQPAPGEAVTITLRGAQPGDKLHWGVDGFQTPNAAYQPAGTMPWPGSGAVETPFPDADADGNAQVVLGPFDSPSQAVGRIDFVIHRGDDSWDNNGGQNYRITFTAGGPTVEPFVMDGQRDARAVATLTDGASTLWTAWNGRTLYLATEPAAAQGGDTFLLVAQTPGALGAAPWGKAGLVAAWDAFAAAESTNDYTGWFDAAAPAATATGSVFEAAIDLLGSPTSVQVALGIWGTADGASLLRRLGAAQMPDGPSGAGTGSIEALDYATVQLSGTVDNAPGAPGAARLLPPAPNPSSGQTTVSLDLASASDLTVDVVDVLGRRVAVLHAGPLAPGRHAFRLDARTLPAGVYAVRASGQTLRMVQRLTVVR